MPAEKLLRFKRPEDALVVLVEKILAFTDPAGLTTTGRQRLVTRAFAHQRISVQTAIRKHWVIDHLPFYAALIDFELSDHERDLAERFWAEIASAAESHKPRRRRQEQATA